MTRQTLPKDQSRESDISAGVPVFNTAVFKVLWVTGTGVAEG
jgi:hypothetical protein